MDKIDLSSLPLSELIRIEKEISKVINKVKRSEKILLRKKIEALAAESGFELDEIITAKKPTRKVKPKYRNPSDTNLVWTGRGRKPKWVEEYINNGGSLNGLLI